MTNSLPSTSKWHYINPIIIIIAPLLTTLFRELHSPFLHHFSVIPLLHSSTPTKPPCSDEQAHNEQNCSQQTGVAFPIEFFNGRNFARLWRFGRRRDPQHSAVRRVPRTTFMTAPTKKTFTPTTVMKAFTRYVTMQKPGEHNPLPQVSGRAPLTSLCRYLTSSQYQFLPAFYFPPSLPPFTVGESGTTLCLSILSF